MGGSCTPFPCDDGKLGEQETDIDCGGGTCHKCAGSRHCLVAADCYSGSCDAFTRTCTSLTTVSFAGEMPYDSGDKTYALLSGDLNGDGHIDLAAANEQGNSISVFLNNGDGTFRRLGPFTTGAYPVGGAIADFNHDGIPDVITSDYHGNSVSVLFGIAAAPGKGSGMLGPAAIYPTADGAETQNLALGDLNGDGNLDVVTANPSAIALVPSVSQFLGRADGTFGPANTVTVGVAGSEPYSVAIGDFDGDGAADMAIGDLVNGPIIVRLGNGDGTFKPDVLYPPGGVGAHYVIAVDVDLDGKLDLVSANRGSRDISVLLGRGDGTFKKPRRFRATPDTTFDAGPYSLAVADFNRDGVPDLVAPNYGLSTGSILLGVGDGSFEPPIDAGTTGDNSYGVAVGDFNGDGNPDFATANANSDNVTVKLSTSH